MAAYAVKVTRSLVLNVQASSEQEAVDLASGITWQWAPGEAADLDQGEATFVVTGREKP